MMHRTNSHAVSYLYKDTYSASLALAMQDLAKNLMMSLEG